MFFLSFCSQLFVFEFICEYVFESAFESVSEFVFECVSESVFESKSESVFKFSSGSVFEFFAVFFSSVLVLLLSVYFFFGFRRIIT